MHAMKLVATQEDLGCLELKVSKSAKNSQCKISLVNEC